MIDDTATGMEARRDALYQAVVDHLKGILQDELTADLAEMTAISVVNFISEHWRGQTIYFPMEFRLRMAHRDLEIFQEFTGNYDTLAKKYGCSARSIRRAVERARRIEFARRQPKLPGF